MSDKKPIQIDRKELDALQGHLNKLMDDLPDNQREALQLMLARAASSDAPDEVVNGFLDVAKSKDHDVTLPVLARALDGRSNAGNVASTWIYNVWTHHHK